jgi:hypothetical protein
VNGLLPVVHGNARNLLARRIDSTGCDGAALAVDRHFNATAGSALTAFLEVESQRAIIDLGIRTLI